MAVEIRGREMGVEARTGVADQSIVDDVDRTDSVKDGVYLTWEDLWVTASNIKGASHVILDGLTGYAQPGELLAIMGPSGCGKSTLLDSLAGRLGSNMRKLGQILVNGRIQSLSFGTSAYVTRDDILMTNLTVREVLYYSAEIQLPNSMTMSEKRERADMVMIEMGLKEAMNTRIGGSYTSKGISDGQKRRVSICIEILTRPKLIFLDEPTSGLDSAASFHVMNRIFHLAKLDRVTIVSSIHQPSSEVFELFDNLCLLSSGKTIYFGSTSEANQFFAVNGFACPTFRNPSDHYLRIINKDFDKETGEDEESSARSINAAEAINILTASYKQSKACEQILKRVYTISSTEGAIVETRSQSSFATQFFVLSKRSMLNMNRDLGYYWIRFAMYILLASSVGSE